MKRLLAFLLQAVLLIGLAVWLADQPGTTKIVWHDYVVETSAAFLALVIVAVGFIFYVLFRAWHLLQNGPELWRLGRRVRKLEEGQNFLTQGLVAIAGGQAAEAGRLAVAARKKLGTTTATLLLQAQAAQLAHDHRSARAIFRAMVEDSESAILGYRGLIMEARRAGEWDEVERLAVEVSKSHPDTPWLDWVRFETATRRLAWGEANDALARLAPTRLLDKATLQHHRAALLVAQSQAEAGQGSHDAALQSAEQAVSQAPKWLPALINLARRQAAKDFGRAHRRTIEKAWAIQPHPELVEILRGGEPDAIAFYKQVDRLCRDNENDPASKLALAEAAMSADIWGEARRHLMALIASNNATQSAYRLLAKLERRESGDERAAMQWLTKATEAPPDPAWLCSSCGGAHEAWRANCASCGSFATLEWRRPGAGKQTTTFAQPLLSDWS